MRWHNLNIVLPKQNHVPYELTAANVVRKHKRALKPSASSIWFLARFSLMNYATSASSPTAHPFDPLQMLVLAAPGPSLGDWSENACAYAWCVLIIDPLGMIETRSVLHHRAR
jgi:hypothetical protein